MTHSSRNYSWTFLLSVLTIVSCGQPTNTNPTDKKEIVATGQPVDTSLIAVIPFDKSRDWLFDKTYTPSTLTQSDIEKIEALLITCVTHYNNKLSADNKQYFAIDLAKEKYKRQYVAVINNKGDKEVWINCLCRTHGDNWRTSIILVDDGGNCFFNLKINLTKEQCYDLSVNGLA
jgi:hypothetical protein